MDSAMRDMDQLRERDDDTRGRKLGLWALATLLMVCAAFAASSMLGSRDAAEAPALDPWAELALSAPAQKSTAETAAEANIAPEALSFPQVLVEEDDALVEATVRAAEAEHAALVGDPALAGATSALPAGRVVTRDNARLPQLAKHDPLVANALARATRGGQVPAGNEGPYTLQVVSYEARAPAENFAGMLRARSHRAFVMEAEVAGRGRFFRVRVGPFTTRKEAERYQAHFESEEHMHTIVVSTAAK